jgi:phosphinothricin acetyltransferase
LTDAAINEFLRLHSPIQATTRIAYADVQVGDKLICRGDSVTLMLGSANRDPTVFSDPDRLDIARRPNRHLAFGRGIHYCLGAPLAVAQGGIALRLLFERCPAWRLAAQPVWSETFGFRGLSMLEIAQENKDAHIAPLTAADWPFVRAIYEGGIATGQATFEMAAPDWPAWNAAHRPDCRLVARQNGAIAGWAALSPVSRRPVYAGVAEVSVYVAASARGRGVGRTLLTSLIEASESAGIWTLQASVFPENEASIALHRACGFRVVGRRERVGLHHGVWRDTLILERRSDRVGVADQ